MITEKTMIVFLYFFLYYPLDLYAAVIRSTSRCYPKSTHTNTFHKQIYENENICYFIVKNSTLLANSKNDSGFLFDIRVARDICDRENATLPIFRFEKQGRLDDNESKWFDRVYGAEERVEGFYVDSFALGIRDAKPPPGGPIQFFWDDGSEVKHGQIPWTQLSYNDSETAYTRMRPTTKDKGQQWETIVEPKMTQKPIAVVCREPETWCEKPFGAFERHTNLRINDESCFFIVKNAIDEANKKVGDKYFFDFWKAHEICESYDATLPTIHSKEEHESIRSFVGYNRTRTAVALGLHQRPPSTLPYNYRWMEDRYIITYQAYWPNKYERAWWYTLLLYNNSTLGRGYNVSWRGYAKEEGHDIKTVVVCQQPYRQTWPWFEPLPNSYATKCYYDATASQNEKTKIKSYNYKFCYFIVKEATKIANRNEHFAESGFQFDIWEARKQCKLEDATLLTIESEEEYQFVMSDLNISALNFESESESVVGVALDMNQEGSPNDYSVNVINKTGGVKRFYSINYTPPIWYNKDKYAFYTIMLFNETAWLNIGEKPDKRAVGVLCKQPYAIERPTSAPIYNYTAPEATTKDDFQVGLLGSSSNRNHPNLWISSLILIIGLMMFNFMQ